MDRHKVKMLMSYLGLALFASIYYVLLLLGYVRVR